MSARAAARPRRKRRTEAELLADLERELADLRAEVERRDRREAAREQARALARSCAPEFARPGPGPDAKQGLADDGEMVPVRFGDVLGEFSYADVERLRGYGFVR